MKCRSMKKILLATQLMPIIGYKSEYITVKDTLNIYVVYQARCCEPPSTGKNSIGTLCWRTTRQDPVREQNNTFQRKNYGDFLSRHVW